MLAEPRVFYRRRRLGETSAYALEWINAFAHVPSRDREGLLLHGGTAAQLLLQPRQRFSRDVDLIGHEHGRIEAVLDSVRARYDGRLFQWEATAVEFAEIDLQRFSAYFKNAAGEDVPVKIDVTYLPVSLDTARVRLALSEVYVPRDLDDSVETLTAEAFIADKLPTLGFETLGYRRVADELGHAEHVWKQLHDLSRLVVAAGNLGRVPALYEESIRARNRARGLSHAPEACLRDAARVSMTAIAAAVYPYNDDRPSDEYYTRDVEHVRSGLGRYREHLMGRPTLLDDAAGTALLARGLLAVRAGEITTAELARIFARIGELVAAAADSPALRSALKARFDRVANPPGWDAPTSSRRLYRVRPSAAIAAWLAADITTEMRHLRSSGRFSFEPGE